MPAGGLPPYLGVVPGTIPSRFSLDGPNSHEPRSPVGPTPASRQLCSGGDLVLYSS